LTGYSIDDLNARDPAGIIHADDREFVLQYHDRRMKGHKVPEQYAFRLIDKGGNLRWVERTVSSIVWEGRPAALVLDSDVTERQQAEYALRESEEKLRRMFECVTDGMAVVDMNGVICEANEKMVELFGAQSKDELLGKTILQFVATSDRQRASENIRRRLEEGFVGPVEYGLVKAGGFEFSGEISAGVLQDAAGNPNGLIAMARDVTDQKRLRENMQFYIQGVTRVQEEERRRIARELHDETIQSLAALSVKLAEIGRSEQFPKQTVQRLDELRTEVVDIAHQVRGFAHELRPEVLDQIGLLAALELLADDLAKHTAIDTRVEVVGSERRLSAEAELALFRIGQEGLRNVTKHSGAKAAVLRVEFSPRSVKMNLSDDGKGFELPVMLADLAPSRKLGLVGMQERARLLGCSFSVESRPGKGTTIAVEVLE
jgi:PAS domain S-box-containing protein